MKAAFWDASALVSSCVEQQSGPRVRHLLERYEIAVWWATLVEMSSGFERLLRMGELTYPEHAAARTRLEMLRRSWREVQPSEAVRAQAEAFLKAHPLKAADALQLAAAWIWCSGDAPSCGFLSGDVQLLEDARQVGFQVVSV